MKLAGCIIKNGDGKVLLLHRNTARRVQWEIPGGKVDPGEAVEQTAVRELTEELDVTVRIVRRIGSKVFEEDGERHEYDWFEAEVVQGTPRLAEPHTFDRLDYFDIDEMQEMFGKLSPNTKNFVLALKGGEVTL
jgi:8-oxo-dGTP diphosphatase